MTPRLLRASLPARRRAWWRPGLVAVLLVLVLPAAALAWDTGAFSAQDESRLVSLTNQRRAASGLSSLSVDATLASVARSRSKRMGDSHTFTHTIGGTTAFDELRARGYCFLESAENIAWNTYPDDQATTVAWQTLLSSSSHLANILGSAYNRIGVGAYKAADGTHAYVLLFAHACGTTATPKPAATTPPVSRTPTRAPTATSAPRLTAPSGVELSAQAVGEAAPTAPSDAERPRPASATSNAELLDIDEILELLLPLLRTMAGAGA